MTRSCIIPEDSVAPAGQQEVVLAEDLAPIIRRELRRGNPAWEGGIYDPSKVGDDVLSVVVLSERCGVPEREINRILVGESTYIDLDRADTILLRGFDLHIELELPDDAFYPKRMVTQAVYIQTEMLREFWCRARGIHWSASRKSGMGGKMRRLAYLESVAE